MTKSSVRKAAAEKTGNKYRKTTRKVGTGKARSSARKTASKTVAESARDNYRKTGARFEQFAYDAQMPESMRALAENSIAQVRELYAYSLEAALENWERFTLAAGQGTVALNRRAIDIARRTDVDVLMVDDLPTAVSVSKALQLAEQGRLVIALLPGATVEAALEVLIDRTCSPRDVVCRQLSRVLQAVIAQRLIWRSEPGPAELGGASVGKRGRLAVHEILVMNEAARKCVMNGQMDLREVMETNMMVGMQTMDQSILAAYQRGDIGYDTAANQMRDPSSLKD